MADNISPHKPKILCVDDDNTTLLLYKKYLKDTGYVVLSATDARDGLELAKAETPDVIVSDVVMPGDTGFDFCAKVREEPRLATTIFLLASGKKTNAADSLKGVDVGADDYLMKPFEQDELIAKLKAFLRIKNLQDDLQKSNRALNKAVETLNAYKAELEEKNTALTEEKEMLENSLKQISLMVEEREKTNRELAHANQNHEKDIGSLIAILSDIIESKRQYHRGHSKKVAEISVFIATALDLSETEIRDIEIAALLHELGKLTIPEDLAMKNPENYTQQEMDFLVQHPAKGAKALEKFTGFGNVAEIIRHFHENYDGSGCPDNLRGDDIPIGARIIAAANLFDNLLFRKQDGNAAATFAILDDLMGARFDPAIGHYLHQYARAHPPDETARTRELQLYELQPGMTLASGIYTINGTKLLPIDTVLTESAINRLANYNKTEPIKDTVFIKV